jgi:hypothetical protein
MSALGQKQTYDCKAHVRFTLKSGHFLAGVSAEPPDFDRIWIPARNFGFQHLAKQGYSTANFPTKCWFRPTMCDDEVKDAAAYIRPPIRR